mgnify:CR=1 FL=1
MKKQAIEVKVSEVSTQCAILCNQIIKENYLNDSKLTVCEQQAGVVV